MPQTGWGWLRAIVVFLVATAALGALTLFFIFETLPTVDEIRNRQVSQSTKIYDRTGAVLLYEISGGEKRTVISLSEVPESLRAATISVEDERFYEQPGFDWRAILRAVLVNLRLREGRLGQGGSSITQQLARTAFLTTERSYVRKVRELVLAIQLDRQYAKDQILELYLNEVPYGPTIYGVESASRAYFGKSAQELNIAQAAVIASLPQAPSYYSPWGSHVKELLSRQQFIIKKMRDLGKITPGEAEAALSENLVFQPRGDGIKAPHFVVAVQDYLVKKYGEELVRTGGFRVLTTLDWDLQETAERVVREGAERNEKLYAGTNAALIAQDPRTGEVLALVGSRDYFNAEQEGNFNVATQGLRQPGSALKPFAYLAAFQKGFLPETVLFDVPTEFVPNNDACPIIPNFNEDNPVCFHPQNFDHEFRGPVSMRDALAQSINIPAVKTLYLASPDNVIGLLSGFGVSTLNDPRRYGLSLVLGGGEVRLNELVGAYGVLAQEGVRRDQALVLTIKDSQGRVLERLEAEGENVADSQLVRQINDILSDTDARSGLFGNSLNLTVFPGHEVALKTGTSNDYRDAWALGYTPSLVVGVWAGNNNNKPMHRQGSSILAAVPIWHDFMAEALKSQPSATFTRPDPATAAKPVLGGEYVVNGQIHSILYYVDRDNPTGDPPSDPSLDPQFNNWELPIILWAAVNAPGAGFGGTTIGDPAAPRIVIISPTSGAFITDRVVVSARISAASQPARISVFWNGTLVQQTTEGLTNPAPIFFDFAPQNPAPQNILEIEAATADGKTARQGVIVYR